MVTLCLGFMACIYFLGETSPFMNYISLYFCIATVAGSFNVSFVMTECRVLKSVMGAFLEIVVGSGTMSCLLVPFILQRGLEFTTIVAFCYGLPLMILLWNLPPPLNEQSAAVELSRKATLSRRVPEPRIKVSAHTKSKHDDGFGTDDDMEDYNFFDFDP